MGRTRDVRNWRPPCRAACACAVALLLSCHHGAGRGAELRVDGWAPYWDLPAAMATALGGDRPRPRPSGVFLFVAHLDEAGVPVAAQSDEDYGRVADVLRAGGAVPWLTIVNDVVDASGRVALKSPRVVHDVLADAGRRRDHRQRIVALARAYRVSGIDLDYESLWAADRDLLSAFVAELAGDARAAGLQLSVTVQPKSTESASDGPGAEDWATLCRSADRLQIMMYNLHGASTPPGPLATPRWIEQVLAFAAAQCPADKIAAALKVIGAEWSPDGVRDVPFAEAMELARTEGAAVQRDAEGDVPWFAYGPEGERTVYFEDARSLRLKMDAALRGGARQVVLWSLGEEDPSLWRVVGELQNRNSSRSVAVSDR